MSTAAGVNALADLGSFTSGDLIYATGASTLAKRAIGATGTVLYVTGGLPTWSTLASVDLTDNASIAKLDENETVLATWSFNNLITMVGTPSSSTHVVNKAYVDGLIAGVRKTSVRVATTAAGTLATSFENGDTIDSVTLVTGDRILIKDQAAPAENGIYTVNVSGAPTRATDMDAASEVDGTMVIIEDGGQAGTVWYTVSEVTTINTDSIVFTQLDTTTITASNGLTKTGNNIALGGTLTGATTVTTGTDYVTFSGSSTSSSQGALRAYNSSTGLAFRADASGGPGAVITAAGGSTALSVTADTTGIAINALTSGIGAQAIFADSGSGSGAIAVYGTSSVGTGL